MCHSQNWPVDWAPLSLFFFFFFLSSSLPSLVHGPSTGQLHCLDGGRLLLLWARPRIQSTYTHPRAISHTRSPASHILAVSHSPGRFPGPLSPGLSPSSHTCVHSIECMGGRENTCLSELDTDRAAFVCASAPPRLAGTEDCAGAVLRDEGRRGAVEVPALARIVLPARAAAPALRLLERTVNQCWSVYCIGSKKRTGSRRMAGLRHRRRDCERGAWPCVQAAGRTQGAASASSWECLLGERVL